MQNDQDFQKLVDIFKALRDPENGCPWDLKQTHESLTEHLLEESYELIDAIKLEPEKIKEELGDVLLQVMLHSQIASDEQRFDIHDVIQELSTKLIERHPHVFGKDQIDNAEDVKKNWDKLKNEKHKKGRLSGIPKTSPALLKAELIGKKVAAVNFDWETTKEIKEKVKEELEEFLQADSEKTEEEFGDLLFTLSQLARKQGISSEDCLQQACKKFQTRFEHMEKSYGKDLAESKPEELENLWQEAKQSM